MQACELAGDWPGRAVCLTFDDAYQSTLTHGIEVMHSEGVSASIYAVSAHMGYSSVWDGERAAKLASSELVVEASLLGFEIGNHTSTHPKLKELQPFAQIDELRKCHQALVDLNIQPSSIAYPYGSFNEDTKAIATDLGYSVGLALSRRSAEKRDDCLALPRIVVSYGDSLPMLLYKLHIRPKLRSSKRREGYVT